MEEIAFVSLFIVGLSYGATACLLSCMPLLSPILLANSRSLNHAMGVVLPFSFGRVMSYIAMAMFASVSAVQVRSIIDNPVIAQTVLGTATLAVAILIIYRSFNKNSHSCTGSHTTYSKGGAIGYFGMGLAISLNPCMPVLTLIATAANTTSISSAILMGLSFGLGAIFATLLFYGFLISSIAREIISQFKEYHHLIERSAGLLLALTAVFVFNGWIKL